MQSPTIRMTELLPLEAATVKSSELDFKHRISMVSLLSGKSVAQNRSRLADQFLLCRTGAAENVSDRMVKKLRRQKNSLTIRC